MWEVEKDKEIRTMETMGEGRSGEKRKGEEKNI